MKNITRLFDIIDYTLKTYNNKVAIAGKNGDVWYAYSHQEYKEMVDNLSYGLMESGIKPCDKITTITGNCPEWNIVDLAILQIGAIHVPVYPNISDAEYDYILNHAEVKMVFVAGMDMYKRIKTILPNISSLKKIYAFKNIYGFEHFNELIELGKQNPKQEELQKIKDSIGKDDLATLIYTSGTTGQPKGVMLSHNNLLTNAKAVMSIPPDIPGWKILSFLPLCHVYERMMNYVFQVKGYSIYYVENPGRLSECVGEIKPNIIVTVPRVMESIFDKITAKGRKLTGIKKLIFFWAINKVALKYKHDKKQRPFLWGIKRKIADKLIFQKIKDSLGGELEIIVSGGAAIQIRLLQVFWAFGISVIEGYGLTETSPVIAVNNFDKNGIKFGTVGLPIEGVDVKIAKDGEILCKGPNLMLGYYKSPDLTKEVIDEDGYFHTGDIGIIEPEGYLKITDRKKEMFKNSGGKYIAPQAIENKFKESPFIEQLLVFGENQKFAAAIISPNFAHLESWCEVKGLEYSNNHNCINNPKIINRIQKEVIKLNDFFGEAEKIKKFKLVEDEWSVQTGELTPTLKLKRKTIMNNYKHLIDKIYVTTQP